MNQISMKITDKRTFGDILLAELTFTDWSWSKLRPVLVLYRNWDDYTILKISSQQLSWATLPLPIDANNNLKADSTIDLLKVSTYHSTLFFKKLGEITPHQKEQIKNYWSNFITSR